MNKNIENKWIQLILYVIITIIMSIIIFPFFDYIYSLLSNNSFVYSIHEHIQKPIETGLILGIVSWVVSNNINKKKSN